MSDIWEIEDAQKGPLYRAIMDATECQCARFTAEQGDALRMAQNADAEIDRLRREHHARMLAHDAILGWLLRDAIANDSEKAVFSGIATHAYYLARDDGKDRARLAAANARAEAHRLVNDLSGTRHERDPVRSAP